MNSALSLSNYVALPIVCKYFQTNISQWADSLRRKSCNKTCCLLSVRSGKYFHSLSRKLPKCLWTRKCSAQKVANQMLSLGLLPAIQIYGPQMSLPSSLTVDGPLFTVVQQGPFFCRVQDVKEDSLLLGLKSRANGREIASHALFFAATWAIKGNWRENSSNGTKDREVSDVLKKIAKRIANNFQYRS